MKTKSGRNYIKTCHAFDGLQGIANNMKKVNATLGGKHNSQTHEQHVPQQTTRHAQVK